MSKTIHAEKWYAILPDFCMAALVFLTGHAIKARTHAHAKIAHFPTRHIIIIWKALVLQPHVSQDLMMHLVMECAISSQAWVLSIIVGKNYEIS